MASRLQRAFGAPDEPPATDPFSLIVWETVAYLVDDTRRRRVFERVREQIGIDPDAILSTPVPELAEIIREDGGMQPTHRAEKLHRAAALAVEIGATRLRQIAREPVAAARKTLDRFHGFGTPGVDKILMFNDGLRSLAPDSNASRVLIRLGYGTESDNYSRQYRSITDAIDPELPAKHKWLVRTHLSLRRHGQTICRRTAPQCDACPLTARCLYYRRSLKGVAAPRR